MKLDSFNSKYFEIKAILQLELKLKPELLNTLNSAILIFPINSTFYNLRGNIYLSSGDFDYAIQDFTKSIEYAKNDTFKSVGFVNRGAAKKYKRDHEGAYIDYIEAYKIDSTDVGTLNNLGTVCDEVGRGDETMKYFLKIIEIDSTCTAAYINIGFKYQEMGEYAKSIKYFDKAVVLEPNQALSYSNRSYSKLKLGDLKGGMKDIEKSLKLYPSNSYAYRTRALIYIELGKKEKACDDLETAINYGFTVSYGKEVYNLMMLHCK